MVLAAGRVCAADVFGSRWCDYVSDGSDVAWNAEAYFAECGDGSAGGGPYLGSEGAGVD